MLYIMYLNIKYFSDNICFIHCVEFNCFIPCSFANDSLDASSEVKSPSVNTTTVGFSSSYGSSSSKVGSSIF